MAMYATTISRVLKGNYGGASAEERREAVREIIQVCSISAGAVACQPIPVVDTVLVVPIQIALVQAVGRIHGYTLDKKSVLEILSSFGASMVAQNVIMATVKLVPVVGWVAGMAMAYALTYAVGEVSDYYFREGRGVDPDDLKVMFEKIYKEKRTEKEKSYRASGSLKDRLNELKQAYKAGLISEEEFEEKKAQILDEFS